MILAAMQPYFFPYIGYFQLMKHVDKFIIFDNAQYMRHSWVNRNRILSPNTEKRWQYINVPLTSASQSTSINEMKISDSFDWENIIFGKLSYYKFLKAPNYKSVINALSTLQIQSDSLLEINLLTLKLICDYIGIKFNYCLLSNENDFPVNKIEGPGDWALTICKHFNASSYLNPINGEGIFDKKKFLRSDIKIQFIKSKFITYDQLSKNFEPWLSVIDIMMFNDKKTINHMLKQYKII